MIRMRETRTAKGLSLSGLAEATGIDPSTLSRYEKGLQSPSVERGFLVANALGVSLEFLVGSTRAEADTAATARVKGSEHANGGRAIAVESNATPVHTGG